MIKLNGLKSIAIAAIACACVAAPVSGFAQHYNHNDYHFSQNDIKGEVQSTERESNSFRSYFEHNFRDNGHQKRSTGGYGAAEHMSRGGQMTLQDTIQNLDEDFERLRSEVNHHGTSQEARSLMNEIVNHMRDVDVRIDRVADNYAFGRDRDWRYKNSELNTRWQDLKDDINELSRQVG